MALTLKRGATRKEIDLLEKRLARRKRKKIYKGFDAKKYNGVLKLKTSPLAIQKQLRDEWEKDPS